MNEEAAKALAAAPADPTLEEPLRRVRYRGRNPRHFSPMPVTSRAQFIAHTHANRITTQSSCRRGVRRQRPVARRF